MIKLSSSSFTNYLKEKIDFKRSLTNHSRVTPLKVVGKV